MPRFLSGHSKQLPVHPSSGKIWLGLALITIGAWGVTWLAVRAGKRSVPACLVFGGTAAMLFNVLLPHIPAALLFRGYTPGIVTAVLVNLPVMSLLMLQALREQWVSGRRAAAYALLVPLGLTACIVLVFAGS